MFLPYFSISDFLCDTLHTFSNLATCLDWLIQLNTFVGVQTRHFSGPCSFSVWSGNSGFTFATDSVMFL